MFFPLGQKNFGTIAVFLGCVVRVFGAGNLMLKSTGLPIAFNQLLGLFGS